jgi:hypothetical protein
MMGGTGRGKRSEHLPVRRTERGGALHHKGGSNAASFPAWEAAKNLCQLASLIVGNSTISFHGVQRAFHPFGFAKDQQREAPRFRLCPSKTPSPNSRTLDRITCFCLMLP